MKIDMWYDDDIKSADEVTYTFYDRDAEYRGVIYREGKAIGDYSTSDSLEIEKFFPWLSWETGSAPLYNNFLR